MPCRVGISTQPEERLKQWADQVEGFRESEIVDWYDTFEEAQTHENFLAEFWECEAEPGGSPAPGPWAVYYFEYDREKE